MVVTLPEPAFVQSDLAKGPSAGAVESRAEVRVQLSQRRSKKATTKGSDPAAELTALGIQLSWVPEGKFTMGSKLSPGNVVSRFGGLELHWQDENPKRPITLSEGFWLGRYEVTNAQFERFVTAARYTTDAEKEGWSSVWNESAGAWKNAANVNWRNPGFNFESNAPVVCVSWNDAQSYIAWLNQQGDGVFRLPTEVEWEYACRAVSTKVFPWGDDPEDGKGNENVAKGDQSRAGARSYPFGFDDGFAYTAPVGSFAPNEWNLYDMVGNVREWCQDWYRSDYYDSLSGKSSRTDPVGPDAGVERVIRGGSWFNPPRSSRPANRYGRSPNHRDPYVGMRVAYSTGASGGSTR
jgi:formylglycine-generating enzyme required for sulfatase activity